MLSKNLRKQNSLDNNQKCLEIIHFTLLVDFWTDTFIALSTKKQTKDQKYLKNYFYGRKQIFDNSSRWFVGASKSNAGMAFR